MNMFKKMCLKCRNLIYGLFFGMKNTEEMVLTTQGIANEGTSIQQQITSNRVSHALLRGELTQEVKELRYRTYKVDREAKQYQYYAPTLTIKRDEKLDSKFVKYENEDNMEIVTIQPNNPIEELMSETLDGVGTYGKVPKYNISIERDFVSRYKIEEYTKRLVVKRMDDIHYILDFYVSIYPNDKDFKSKGFVREIEKIRDEGIRSDILDFDSVSFITSHAYRMNDMIKFAFDKLYFNKIVEYDGYYIIRYKASLKNQYDVMDDYYCKEMDEKYKNNTKKDIVLDMFGGNTKEIYHCDECGKEIVYDTSMIDNMEISSPSDIDEKNKNATKNLEYLDLQIIEQTFGKKLCSNCLNKYLKRKNK